MSIGLNKFSILADISFRQKNCLLNISEMKFIFIASRQIFKYFSYNKVRTAKFFKQTNLFDQSPSNVQNSYLLQTTGYRVFFTIKLNSYKRLQVKLMLT